MFRSPLRSGPHLLALLAAALILVGCSSTPTPTFTPAPVKPAATAPPAKPPETKPAAPAATSVVVPGPTAAPAASKVRQGGELKVGLWQEPASLDPTNANTVSLGTVLLLYDTLVTMDKSSKLHPGLAESWQAAPDGKSYTFKLRPGVKFHDGTPFNAETVKASLDWATRKEATGRFDVVLQGVYVTTEVVDNLTARVVLKESFAPFLQGLSGPYYGIVSPTAVKKYGKDFDRNPVGTGPFMFVEWATNDHITLKRNPDYNWAPPVYSHQGPAYLDRITFRLIPEASTRLGTLETGEMHLIEEPSFQDLPQVEKDKKFQVFKQPIPGPPLVIPVNVERPPTNELAVRKAILYAVDQEAISKTVYMGIYPPAYAPLIPGTFGYDEGVAKLYRHDSAKARELLENAGWKVGPGGIRQKEGKPLKVSMYIITGVFPMDPVSQLVQAQLRDVGIEMEIMSMARPPWNEAISRGDNHLRVGWRDSADPDVLRPWFHSSTINTSANTTRVRDPKFDAMLEEGYRTVDTTQRLRVYRDVQQYVMDNVLMVPLTERMNTVVARKDVQGLAFDVRASTYYYDVWLGP